MVRQRIDDNMVYLRYIILNISIKYSINIMNCTHLLLRVHICKYTLEWYVREMMKIWYIYIIILYILITYIINIMICTHLALRVYICNIHLNVMSEN